MPCFDRWQSTRFQDIGPMPCFDRWQTIRQEDIGPMPCFDRWQSTMYQDIASMPYFDRWHSASWQDIESMPCFDCWKAKVGKTVGQCHYFTVGMYNIGPMPACYLGYSLLIYMYICHYNWRDCTTSRRYSPLNCYERSYNHASYNDICTCIPINYIAHSTATRGRTITPVIMTYVHVYQ